MLASLCNEGMVAKSTIWIMSTCPVWIAAAADAALSNGVELDPISLRQTVLPVVRVLYKHPRVDPWLEIYGDEGTCADGILIQVLV